MDIGPSAVSPGDRSRGWRSSSRGCSRRPFDANAPKHAPPFFFFKLLDTRFDSVQPFGHFPFGRCLKLMETALLALAGHAQPVQRNPLELGGFAGCRGDPADMDPGRGVAPPVAGISSHSVFNLGYRARCINPGPLCEALLYSTLM